MQFLAVIPARYQSTRFPGKPLVDIAGTPMIDRVYHQVLQSKLIKEVVIATDSELIREHCNNAKMRVIMTSKDHQSGTDRVAEVAADMDANVIVNVQGDEPFIPPEYIDKLCRTFEQDSTEIATLIAPIKNEELRANPNIVKMVRRKDGRALYFSRSAIPYRRNETFIFPTYRHLGIYAFRRETLGKLAFLDRGNLEQYEMLEQLRWLEAGFDIMTAIVEEAPMGVDVPEDVDKILAWMKDHSPREY